MTLTELPPRIVIGDTVFWDETLPDYLSTASWVLKYHFTSPNDQFSSTHLAGFDGSHRVTIDTTNLEPGRYEYAKKIAGGVGSETFTLERGYLVVDPDLSADTTGVDRREFAEKALENIELMLVGKASKDQSSFSLNGRALSRYSIAELRDWRGALKTEVADLRQKARRAAGGKSHQNVHLRMSSDV